MYEQTWVALMMAFVLGLLGVRIAARHLREQKALRLREMIHRERMTALEKGLPAPDDAELPRFLAEARTAPPVDWGARGALGAGIVLFFGGVGLMSAFRSLPERLPGSDALATDLIELKALWPLGTIPMMIGVGLVIFFFIVSRKDHGDDEGGPEAGKAEPRGIA